MLLYSIFHFFVKSEFKEELLRSGGARTEPYSWRHLGRFPFDQKLQNSRNRDIWYGLFLGKGADNSRNCRISEKKKEPFNRKFRKFSDENQTERKFPGTRFRKFGKTSRGCPLFRNLSKFAFFYSPAWMMATRIRKWIKVLLWNPATCLTMNTTFH